MAVELRHLRHFIAAVENGTLSKAASALRISQPALSKSIHATERSLGVNLLNRGPHGVTPTVFGQSLYTHAKAIDAEIAHAKTELELLRGGSGGFVKIGVIPTVASTVVPEAVLRLTRSGREICVRIVEQNNVELIRALQRGEFDFIVSVIHGDGLRKGLVQETLFHDRLAIIGRSGHPLRRNQAVYPADLVSFPWILPIRESLHRERLEEIFHSAGVALPPVRIECSSVQYIRSVLPQSDYLAFAPRQMVDMEITAGLLSEIDVAFDFPLRFIGFVFRQNHVLSATAELMVNTIREAGIELGYER